jgi:hypothetical protein
MIVASAFAILFVVAGLGTAVAPISTGERSAAS